PRGPRVRGDDTARPACCGGGTPERATPARGSSRRLTVAGASLGVSLGASLGASCFGTTTPSPPDIGAAPLKSAPRPGRLSPPTFRRKYPVSRFLPATAATKGR